MPKLRNYQTNFSGGLLSEGMLGRVDLAQYENGCKQLKNCWPNITGGMRRRPGTLFLADTDAWILNDSSRLVPFVFSDEQNYLFVFMTRLSLPQGVIQVYNEDTGALITTVVFDDAIADETTLREMSISQIGDVMVVAHDSFETRIIRRTGASTFVVETLNDQWEELPASVSGTKACPFVKRIRYGVSNEVTVSVNNYLQGVGAVMTATEALFTDDHVGNLFRYRGAQVLIGSLVGAAPATACNITILQELPRSGVFTVNTGIGDKPRDFIIGEIIVGRTTGYKAEVLTTTSTSLSVAFIAGEFPVASTEQIEGLESGNIATLTASTQVNPLDTDFFDEEAFTDESGWPSVVEFHSQRLWLAGSSSLPAHIFGSRLAAFFNFDVGDAFPADSIQAVIADNQVNKIQSIVSGRHLQVFTDAAEYYAPQSEDRPLTPETFNLIKQTRYGIDGAPRPIIFDESTLFAQGDGNAIREFIWVDGLRGYSSDAISFIADEFLSNVKETTVLYGGYDRPEQCAFFLNEDGTVVWYHAARAENIRTWGVWDTQGEFESLCVMDGKLYAIVKRDDKVGVNDTQWLLERFEFDVTLDCAEQVADSAKSVWTGDHPSLEDFDVQVTTSVIQTAHDPDYYLGEYTYTGQSFDLGLLDADNVTIGLGFTQIVESMPIEVRDPQGLSTGRPKRIVSADLYIASTAHLKLEGNRITTFEASADLSEKPELFTGQKKFYLLGYQDRPTITIENDIPVVCQVLSLATEVEY